MEQTTQLQLTLLAGSRALLAEHARELPQRDDLCGAFCAALALRAAGIEQRGGEPVDQDAAAQAAGTVVSRVPDVASLPHGERGRRDYRIAPPLIDDASVSGTNCAGVVAAIGELSGESLVAIPYAGPWTATALDGLFELLASLDHPTALIANVATRHLWGGAVRADQLLDHLLDGVDDGPPPDWDVGHFVCVVARTRGPAGSLYAIADTYPSLGSGGVHVQPRERLARALQRPQMAPGGAIAVVADSDAAVVRAGAQSLGLREGVWDNGSVTAVTPA
ncbi:MAG TPA: hypothetical protein VGO29_03545 [Solirubrobacteraceae bacterium]|nr:hypothetical protein [Solirubrobacteraceae bacterium]